MTAPDPADVALFREQLRIHGIGQVRPHGNISPTEALAAALAVIAPRIRQQAAAQERERWLAAVKASNCVASCDDDCECGPVHCLFTHLPGHKPGWHSAEQCPFADLLRAEQ